MFCVYILYSELLDSYYIGEAEDVDKRLLEHNSGFYKFAFTKKAKDWKMFYIIECNSRIQSRKIETHIKQMKSKKYFQDLILLPEIDLKLKDKYI